MMKPASRRRTKIVKTSYIIYPLLIAALLSFASCARREGRYAHLPHRKLSEVVKAKSRSEIKLVINDRVRSWIDYFTGRGRSWFEQYLERSGRYIPLMKEILKEHNIPEDAVYLAMIESGFSPKATSSASAVGYWQFITSTARRYGLRVDQYVDERRDPVKSTRAAANYLADLFNEFGDWYLAFAGYNSGEGKVRGAIQQYGWGNFWELTGRGRDYFRQETKDYVPKYIAAAIIAKNPKRFGFRVHYQKPIEYDVVRVNQQTDVDTIARCTDVPVEEIEALNPELVMGITPPHRYDIKVPKGTGEKFLVAFSKLPKGERLTRKFYETTAPLYHYVKRGDTLAKIAKRYGVSVKELVAANRLNKRRLRVGLRLTIPGKTKKVEKMVATAASASDNDEPPLLVGTLSIDKLKRRSGSEGIDKGGARYNNKKRGTSGSSTSADTDVASDSNASDVASDVASIAQAGEAQSESGLAGAAGGGEVGSGVGLKAAPPVGAKDASLTGPDEVSSTSKVTTISREVASTKYHTVVRGDTLAGIAKKYGITVAQIQKWNKINGVNIRAGERLIVSKREVFLPTPATGVAVLPKAGSKSSSGSNIYKVVYGDTLYAISRKTGMSVASLCELNKLSRNAVLRPGMLLRLKGEVVSPPAPLGTPPLLAKGGSDQTIGAGPGANPRHNGAARQPSIGSNSMGNPKGNLQDGATSTSQQDRGGMQDGATGLSQNGENGTAALSQKDMGDDTDNDDTDTSSALDTAGASYPVPSVLGAGNGTGSGAANRTGSGAAIPRAPRTKGMPAGTGNVKGKGFVKYKVRKGDTAWEIAKRHNISIVEMQAWNNNLNLKRLKPGDVLKIKTSNPKTK